MNTDTSSVSDVPADAGVAPIDVTAENAVVAKLKSFNVEDAVIAKITGDLGVESVDDLLLLEESNLVGVGMKAIPAKRLLASVKGTAAGTNGKTTNGTVLSVASILPPVPDDMNLLAALKIGGVLKIGETEVISAIKAGLFAATKVDEIPRLLLAKMKQFARAQKEQVPAIYRKMKKVMARRSYAEVLAALEGAEGVTTVPKEDKDYMLDQVLSTVFPALASFQYRLSEFVAEYRKTGFDPMLLLQAISGGPQNALMGISTPDLDVLRTAAETVIDDINGAFAGDGCIAARALAFDAIEIVQALNEPGLPAAIGAASREHMLRTLGIEVASDYERLEKTVPQYALSILKFNKQIVPGCPEELGFIAAMNQLGSQIPWDLITNKKGTLRRPAGIGGGRNSDDEEDS